VINRLNAQDTDDDLLSRCQILEVSLVRDGEGVLASFTLTGRTGRNDEDDERIDVTTRAVPDLRFLARLMLQFEKAGGEPQRDG
jgi:hypothetical protein